MWPSSGNRHTISSHTRRMARVKSNPFWGVPSPLPFSRPSTHFTSVNSAHVGKPNLTRLLATAVTASGSSLSLGALSSHLSIGLLLVLGAGLLGSFLARIHILRVSRSILGLRIIKCRLLTSLDNPIMDSDKLKNRTYSGIAQARLS